MGFVFEYLLKNNDIKPINETLESFFSYINNYKSLKKMRNLRMSFS